MANIVLNSKTYTGQGIVNTLGRYTERSAGVADGFSPLTGSVVVDTKSRVKWKLSLPIIAEEASACACPGSVLRVADVDITIRMDKGMTLAERTDVADRVKDLTAHATFRDSVISLISPAG